MKWIISLLLCATSAFAANPSFQQFDTNTFIVVDKVSIAVNTNAFDTVAARVAGDAAVSNFFAMTYPTFDDTTNIVTTIIESSDSVLATDTGSNVVVNLDTPLVVTQLVAYGLAGHRGVGAYVSQLYGSDTNPPPGPYSTITNAEAKVTSGQVIYVRDGTFTDNYLGKEGVTYVLERGVIIDGGALGAFYLGTNNNTFNYSVLGRGSFTNIAVFVSESTNARAVFEGHSFRTTTSGSASIVGYGGNTTNSKVTIKGNYVEGLLLGGSSLTGKGNELEIIGYTAGSIGPTSTSVAPPADAVRMSLRMPNYTIGRTKALACWVVFNEGVFSQPSAQTANVSSNVYMYDTTVLNSNVNWNATLDAAVKGTVRFENQ